MFLAPTALAASSAIIVGFVHLASIPPRLALRFYTSVAIVGTTAVALVVGAYSGGFLLGPDRTASILGWCRAAPIHHRVGSVVGLAATLAVGLMTCRVLRVVASHSRATRNGPPTRVHIIETDESIAYAVPSSLGSVVISTGLLAGLSPEQRKVVFAHERAHLDMRHHRHLRVAHISAAIFPLLQPLARQIRHATERCADEQAVVAMKGDRRLVASAIAQAAVRTPTADAVLSSLGGGSVVTRVEALLGRTPTARAIHRSAATAVLLLVITTAGTSIQVHHFVDFFDHLCRAL